MRILRLTLLLIVAVAAFAADNAADQKALKFQPKIEWKMPVRGPDGSFRFTTPEPWRRLVPAGKIPPEMAERFFGGNVCYFIHSYNVKRVDRTDETVPSGETTCTPGSRFQMKQAVAVPAVAR